MFCSHVPVPVSGIDYWKYESVEPNQSIKGWKAGHLVGIPAHHVGATKPCVEAFTKGALPCALPHEQFAVGFHAYMPIITDDGEHLVVGIRRNQFAKATAIPVGDQVVVSRGRHITKPVIAVRKEWNAYKHCSAINPLEPAQIHAWLLRLWKIPTLTAWVMANPQQAKDGPLDTSAFVVAPPAKKTSAPPTPEEREKAREALDVWKARINGNGSESQIANGHNSDDSLEVPIALRMKDVKLPHTKRITYGKRGAK